MQGDMASSADSRTLTPSTSQTITKGRLLGDLIPLLVGLVFHPSSIGKEHDDAEANNKDDAENKDNTGVLAGPVLSFDKQVKAVSLRSVEQTDRRHCAVRVEGRTIVGLLYTVSGV